MTAEEVTAIVGIAPGIYAERDLKDYEWPLDPDFNHLSLCWLGNEGCIIVSLNDEELVYAKKFGPALSKPGLNCVTQFLDWLGLRP